MYAIAIGGDAKFVTEDWHELMKEYLKRRRESSEPVLLGKINEKGDFEECDTNRR